MMSQISWEIVEQIAQGKLGRVMATCPLCSADRSTRQKRHSKVLAVALVEPEFAVFYCNHCGANGYVHPDTRIKAGRPHRITAPARTSRSTRSAGKTKRVRSKL